MSFQKNLLFQNLTISRAARSVGSAHFISKRSPPMLTTVQKKIQLDSSITHHAIEFQLFLLTRLSSSVRCSGFLR